MYVVTKDGANSKYSYCNFKTLMLEISDNRLQEQIFQYMNYVHVSKNYKMILKTLKVRFLFIAYMYMYLLCSVGFK